MRENQTQLFEELRKALRMVLMAIQAGSVILVILMRPELAREITSMIGGVPRKGAARTSRPGAFSLSTPGDPPVPRGPNVPPPEG